MKRSKARVHMLDSARTGVAQIGVCGHMGTCTTRPGRVTCKPCLRAIVAVAAKLEEAARDRRRAIPPAMLDGPGQSDVGAAGATAIAASIAGEIVSTGARWGSVDSAMAALAQTQDSRRSVASSSSPDRFGKDVVRSAAVTPTTPRETRDDVLDIEAALERACVTTRVGDRSLPAAEVRAIAEAMLFGRPVERRVLGRRSTYRERVKAPIEEVAALAELTKHQVAIVMRHVRGRVARHLARKGLIPLRAAVREMSRADLGVEEDDMAVPAGQQWDLEGWKDIAPLVGRSEETCKRLASRPDDPLPIARYLGRVVASRAAVVAWAGRQATSEVA